MNKTELESAISEYFPDINHTEFNINGGGVEGFVQQRLLPFLIYQNTMDSSSRLITLFLEENSPSMHFLPFYIAYGFYRKAVDRIFASSSFRPITFANHQRQVTERSSGAVCSITSINFINQSLTIRSGTGRVQEIPFEEDYQLNWNYAGSEELKKNIRNFERLFSASGRHIFSVPLPPEIGHEGIVVFTQVSKFETLLHSVGISGQSVDENLHIEKTVFTKEGKTAFKRISRKNTGQFPVTVLVSRTDSFLAYHQIIAGDVKKYGKLNSVIIDDFDLILSRELAGGDIDGFMQAMDEVYFSKLGTDIRDIYLVCRDRNFNLYETLNRFYPGVKPWMLKADEHNLLDGLGAPREISIRHFRDQAYTQCISAVESLIDSWRELSIQSPCQGELLPVISVLYRIREKLISFYDPDSLAEAHADLKEMLPVIGSKWFSGGQDNRLIVNSITTLESSHDEQHRSAKTLRESLGSILGGTVQRLIVVTNNDSLSDHHWLSQNREGQLHFITAARFISGDFQASAAHDAIIHLCWNRQIADRILTSRLLPAQYFMLEERGYGFFQSYLPKAWKRLCALSQGGVKYELLNLSKAAGSDTQEYLPPHISFQKLDE